MVVYMRVAPTGHLITYLVPIWWNYWGKIGGLVLLEEEGFEV